MPDQTLIIEKQKEIIELYEEYTQLLGQEIRDLAVIAMLHGWQSKNLKKGADFRTKIAIAKNTIKYL